MIAPTEIRHYLLAAFPDAEVTLTDRTGMGNHFILQVSSAAFAGLNPMDRQRRVYQALSEPLQDGRIHALEIKTQVRSAS